MSELFPSVVVLAVLVTGALLAGLSRLVLPSSRRLAWSTTIVCAVLGAALAWLPIDLAARGVDPWLRLVVGVAGAVVAVRNRDGLQLWLRTMLGERLGKAVTADIGVSFETVDGTDVCRVDVAPADQPVFVGSTGGARTADFHVRIGNATRRLLTDEVLDCRARRWP